MNYQYSFQVDGKEIPYYHFCYEREFKEVLRIRGRRNYYFKDGTYLPQFINQETVKQFDFSGNYPTFNRVMIHIIHTFDDEVARDLDNYNYKPFIDVIRKLLIIKDDSWKQVSLTTIGDYAKDKESIDVYVVPFLYYPEFLKKEFYYFYKSSRFELKSIKQIQKEKDRPSSIKKQVNLKNEEEFF